MPLPEKEKKNINKEADEKLEESPEVPDAASNSSQPTPRRQGASCVGFRTDFVIEAVDKCLQDEGINTDAYINFFAEMQRVFEAIGTLFNFVGLEIYEKVEILRNFRISEGKDRYETVESSLQDFRDRPETIKTANAARTLLRLHRPLELMIMVTRAFFKMEEEDNLGEQIRQMYNSTMAQYHTEQVKQITHAVISVVPPRDYIIKRLLGTDSAALDHLRAVIPALCDRADQLYETTQKLFAKYDQLNLP